MNLITLPALYGYKSEVDTEIDEGFTSCGIYQAMNIVAMNKNTLDYSSLLVWTVLQAN